MTYLGGGVILQRCHPNALGRPSPKLTRGPGFGAIFFFVRAHLAFRDVPAPLQPHSPTTLRPPLSIFNKTPPPPPASDASSPPPPPSREKNDATLLLSCVRSFFPYTWSFLLSIGATSLAIKAICSQFECVFEHLNRL